jgi:ribosomal protein L37AE/L43A
VTANGNRRSWEYPECPFCLTDVLVRDARGGNDINWICEGCGERFT